jgi:signal transduction histidine kinase/CheY-like chemotaxis protein/HPt (histidine-containing phosphotransfer) domain-containing protein/Tfp pilus assembly protein PilF
MKKLFLIIVMYLPLSLHAQKQGKKLIDSLLHKLHHTIKTDTSKVKLLNELSVIYASVNTDEGIKYGELGLMVAENIAWEKGIAMVNNSLGNNYLNKSDYPKALTYFNKALKQNVALHNKHGIADNLRNIGTINVNRGNYTEALENYREALRISQELGDKNGIATDVGNIGNVYQSQSNDPLALEYLLRALKMNEEIGDKSGIANNLNSIGLVYISQGNSDRALENYNKALKINEALGDKANIARNLKNIGNAYTSQHNYERAMEYYGKALKIHDEIGDQSGIARNLGNMGNVYQELGDYSKALDYLMKAYRMNDELGEKYPKANNLGSIGCTYLAIAKDTTETIQADSLIPAGPSETIAGTTENLNKAVEYLGKAIAVDKEIGNLHELQNFAHFFAEAQELLGNYKEAFESYQLYSETKDSVFSIDNNLKIARLDQIRETELKQKQIEMQQLKIAADKNERRYYLTALAMLIILSGGLFQRFRSARKTKLQLEEKNRLIEIEKENADMLRVRAEQSEQFKQQFLTNMSHEIRTPMNAVSGMTDLLLDKEPRPDQRHYLQIISRSSDMLLHIINDILDLSKIEAGKLELEAIDFSLADTVRHVKETLSFRADEKGLQLTTHIDHNIPDVLIGDPFRLNQVLINLGGNAIKFTDSGSVEIRVTQDKITDEDVHLLFKVSDTGIGIPKDKLHTLFESFRQVQNSDTRRYGGTGLGLSIARQLVEAHGGTIDVQSEPGRGTTFSFRLVYPQGSLERLHDRMMEEQKADGRMLTGLRILLTDDNEYNRMVASETIQSKADVTIDEAANGEEAIRQMELNDYDVVLMDIRMPVMNGLEATRYIRSKLPHPKNKTPVIALTASMLRGDVDMCTDAGMDTYVPKPFKAWELISAIADVTGRKPINPRAYQWKKKIAATAGDTAAAGVTDLTYLESFCEGDTERMKKFMGIYMESVPVFITKINKAIADNNKQEIANQVHAFKPNWMMMGMKQCRVLSVKIEELCKTEGQETAIKDELSTLIGLVKSSLTELENKY